MSLTISTTHLEQKFIRSKGETMKRWLILLSLISTLTYSQIYKSEVLDISTNENLIIGKTNRLNFHMFIVVDGNNVGYDDYVKLNVEDTDFIKVVNLHIKNNQYRSTSDGISFVDRNNNLNEKIELSVSGTFIFNWNKNRRNIDRIENIKIGYVSNEQNPLLLSLPILYLNPISNVKVEIIEDMDLGTVFAGEKLSTKQGTPAKIRIEGVKDKSVKITIPSNIMITNSKNESLDVKLSLRDNGKSELIKTFNTDNGQPKDNSVIVLDDILIDVESQTNKTSNGLYEGSFVVRVEYIYIYLNKGVVKYMIVS